MIEIRLSPGAPRIKRGMHAVARPALASGSKYRKMPPLSFMGRGPKPTDDRCEGRGLMRRVLFLLACVALAVPAGASAQQVVVPPPGRYQLVVAAGTPGSPFLVDTTTGCVWATAVDQEGKRLAGFVEVEVENLHWKPLTVQALSQQIDASKEASADQKRAVKTELERTRCGALGIVMTPGQAPGGARPGESKAPPTKR